MQCIFTFTAVLALAFASTMTAQAVTLNPRGLGQVLIYPYYTVNKDQDTLISIGNASDIGKAVRVVVKEGVNGRPVLELTVFLSAHDVWTARVGQAVDGAGAALYTSDTSCTWPMLGPPGRSFDARAYAGGSIYPSDGGPTSVTRTREGEIDVVPYGDIIPGSPLDVAITHSQTGVPNAGMPSCAQEAVGGASPGAYLVAPTSGLFGAAAVVNVGEGTFFAYNASALTDFTALPLFNGSAVLSPLLLRANSAESAAGGAVAHLIADNGTMLALDYINGIDAVSAVFMAESLSNDYLVGAGLGANTDWIVTFPTREFYVDIWAFETPPFAEAAHAGLSNVAIGTRIYDREEASQTPAPVLEVLFRLPYQVNVISFLDNPGADAASGVLGSALTSNLVPFGSVGWADLDMTSGDGGHALPPDSAGRVLHGLPAIGFMVYNIINSNAAPGRLANYGGAFAHRTALSCSTVGANQDQVPCS